MIFFNTWASRGTFGYSSEDEKPANTKLIVGSLLLFTVILVLRSWENFSQPGFYAEDSAHYFNYYYGDIRNLSDVLWNPNGYYNILNNIIAYFVAKADIQLQALLYQITAITISVITIGAISFSGLIRNKYVLFAAPFLLGLSGMNHIYYYITLTFQMYVVVILIFALLLQRYRLTPLGSIFLFFVLSFLIWSGPYSVLIVPFCLVYMALFRDRNVLCVSLIFVTIAYALSVEEKSKIMLENILNIEVLQSWATAIIAKVFYMEFKDSVNTERLVLIFVIFTAIFFVLRRDRFYLKVALLLFALIIASFAPFYLNIKYYQYFVLKPCHLLVAQFFWLVLILFTADRILGKYRSIQKAGGILFLVLITGFVTVDNVANPSKRKDPVLHLTSRFLSLVDEAENMNLIEKGKKMIIIGPGMFKTVAVVGDRGAPAEKTEIVVVQ